MVDVYRVTAVWQGFSGAPGYSRFSFENLTDASSINAAGSQIGAFFQSLAPFLQVPWTITVQPAIQVYDMTSGFLTGEVTMSSPPGAIVGTAPTTSVYTGGAGAYVTWRTGLIFNGHRVRGRTYLVPLVGVNQADGTLATGPLNSIQTAATTLATATPSIFAVWSRQFNTAQPPVQIGGALAPVDSASVPDKSGILRSRRD